MKNSWSSKSKLSLISHWKSILKITQPRKKCFRMIFKSMRLLTRACLDILILFPSTRFLRKLWLLLQSKSKFAPLDQEPTFLIGYLQTPKAMAPLAQSQITRSSETLLEALLKLSTLSLKKANTAAWLPTLFTSQWPPKDIINLEVALVAQKHKIKLKETLFNK